jgi:NitT/TauT family transport system substrate-binding protein
MTTRRRFMVGAATAAASLALRARNVAAQGLEKVSLRFNWSWVGNYAPVVLGWERGYYKDVGIELALGQGKGSGATVRQAGMKNDTFVWADTSALIVSAAQGVPVKEVMCVCNSNLGILWIDGRGINIKSARDLIGKKLSATPGDGNTQMWPAVLAANNMKASDVDVVFLDGTASIAALREGRVDASMGGASDQPVTLRVAGFPAKVITFAELGVPTLGSALITHSDMIKERPDLVAKMVAATQRSWQAGLKDPEAAVQAEVRIAETPLNANVLRDGLKVFQGLATNAQPLGFIDPAAMQKTLDLLKQYGGVKTDLPATAFYTNEFIKKA